MDTCHPERSEGSGLISRRFFADQRFASVPVRMTAFGLTPFSDKANAPTLSDWDRLSSRPLPRGSGPPAAAGKVGEIDGSAAIAGR